MQLTTILILQIQLKEGIKFPYFKGLQCSFRMILYSSLPDSGTSVECPHGETSLAGTWRKLKTSDSEDYEWEKDETIIVECEPGTKTF